MKLLTALTLALLAPVAFAQRPDMLPYTTIDKPEFVAAAEATFLQDDYIVLGVASGRAVLAFPAADLAQHGSAMVDLPDGPVTVTWCGVCNVGAVYRRTLDGRVLTFDYDSMVAGNEVQKDRETGSRWQQAIGEAIDGPLKGKRLKLYPFTRTTWGEWRRQHPDTRVLKPLPGYAERLPLMARLNEDRAARRRRSAGGRVRQGLSRAAARDRRGADGRRRGEGVSGLGAARGARGERSRRRRAGARRASAGVGHDHRVRREANGRTLRFEAVG